MDEDQAIRIWGAGTTRTFRPVWIAEELGLDYEHLPIGPRTGETQTVEYTRLNPKQKVPYLVDGDVRLSESVAISRYLIERYGQPSTIAAPTGLEARAKEDEWVCYVYGELDETSLYVMRRHGDLKEIFGDAPAAVQSAKVYARKHLCVIADQIGGWAFVLGDRLGLVDIILMSCLDWAVHYGIELPDQLTRYRERLSQRDAYQRAFTANYAGHLRGA